VEEALDAVRAMMGEHVFGAAGDEVVIEEFLEGEEVSFFALVDGRTAVPLASAQDHKTAYDNDQGPNTGGMGAYSPAPVMNAALEDEIMAKIIRPTVAGMAAEGRPYKGVLFAGLMITSDGPKTLEFNVRFGDPECQSLMMRLDSDLLELLEATADGTLDRVQPKWKRDTGLVVVMAAKGYPGIYAKGSPIKGLDRAAKSDGAMVFHAGTKMKDGAIVSDGGRVLGVAATGASAKEAQSRAYKAVDALDWPEGFCRRDIGWRAVARLES
jgi:phosphoribosylamine--glycine ligase